MKLLATRSWRGGKAVRAALMAGVMTLVAATGSGSVAAPGDLQSVVEQIRPGGACSSPTGSNNTTVFSENWRLSAAGLTYQVNPGVPRGLDSSAAVAAIQAAAADWDSAGAPALTYGGTTSVKAGRRDGLNAVSFGGVPYGAIAVAYIWSSGGVVVEADMSLANGFRWSTNGTIVENPNSAADDCAGAPDRMDVRDIAEHEFGHWVGAKHTSSDSAYSHRTMFPVASYQELFKRSLTRGDIDSIPTSSTGRASRSAPGVEIGVVVP